jgi:RNA polymerase sigma-70 factor (ECF subfamily)
MTFSLLREEHQGLHIGATGSAWRAGSSRVRERTAVEDTDARPAAAAAVIRSLFQEHGRSMLAYATQLTGDSAAAEDVVQETLIRAWKHADDMVEGKGSVRGWLLTVARNIVTDRARARAARPVEVAEVKHRPPIEGDHSESVVNTMVVMEALDQVSADHREVLVELYYNGRSMTEAARVLGVPPGTVKSRSYYALRAMRDVLTGPGAEVAR